MRQEWKPGNMLYPLPAVMVTSGDINNKMNIFTVAWCGNCCTNPPYVYISVRTSRYSYDLIMESKDYVINLVTKDLVKACDYCGVVSGREHDKFKEMNLTPVKLNGTNVPGIEEAPVNIVCHVENVLELGSHNMLVASVKGVYVNDKFLDEKNYFDMKKAGLVTYSHGEYYSLGEYLGKFGYSIRKKK